MATVTIEKTIPLGESENLYYGVIAMDSSYPTNGEPLDVSGNTRFKKLIVQPTAGYSFEFDEDNQKLKVFDVAGHTHDILIIGGQAASTTNDIALYGTDTLGKEQATNRTVAGSASATKGGVVAVAAGVQVEVANTTDLSALTELDFIGFGY